MYQSGTWLLSKLWTVVCSQAFLAIGWLSAGYWRVQNQDIVIYYYVPKWHMAAINIFYCSVFMRFFGYRLAIGWLCAKINKLQDNVIYYIPKLHMAAINTWAVVCLRDFWKSLDGLTH